MEKVLSINSLWYLFAVSFLFFPFSWARVEFGEFLVPMQLFILVFITLAWTMKFLMRAVNLGSLKAISTYYPVLLCMSVAAAFSLMASGFEHIGRAVHFWVFIGAALFISLALDKEDVQKKVLLVMVAGITLQTIFGIYNFVSGGQTGWLSLGDLVARNANAFIFQIGAIIALTFAFAERLSSAKKFLLVACYLVCVFGVFYTNSRGGLLGVIFATVILMRKSKAAVVMLVIVGLSLMSMPEKYIVRFTSYFNYKESYLMYQGQRMSNSIPKRLTLVSESMEKIVEKPVFGHGPGYFKAANFNAADLEGMLWPHNSYLGMWVETGVMGFVSFVALFLLMLKYIRRAAAEAREKGRDVPVLLNVAFILLVTVYFDSIFMDLYDWITFWIIIGIVAAIVRTAISVIDNTCAT